MFPAASIHLRAGEWLILPARRGSFRSHRASRRIAMLVLERELSQSISIGPDIRVTVCRILGRKVKLGIDAPADVPILRTEIIVASEATADSPAITRHVEHR
jgi:carbon storage regulator